MIDSIDKVKTAALPLPALDAGATGEGGFSAALQAAQKAAAAETARANELAAIREQGFTDWVRDMRIEKLKEELRRRVMAEMGLSEADLSTMTDAMREILEAKIREAVEQALQEQLAKQDGGAGTGTASGDAGPGGAAAPAMPGKNDPPGKKVPVIAALVQAGGQSLF